MFGVGVRGALKKYQYKVARTPDVYSPTSGVLQIWSFANLEFWSSSDLELCKSEVLEFSRFGALQI